MMHSQLPITTRLGLWCTRSYLLRVDWAYGALAVSPNAFHGTHLLSANVFYPSVHLFVDLRTFVLGGLPFQLLLMTMPTGSCLCKYTCGDAQTCCVSSCGNCWWGKHDICNVLNVTVASLHYAPVLENSTITCYHAFACNDEV